MLAFGSPVPFVLPNPDGSNAEDFGERVQYIYLYPGIAPSGVLLEAGSENYFFRWRRLSGG